MTTVIQHYQWPLLSSTTNDHCYPALPMTTVIQHYQSALLFSTTNDHCFSALPMTTVIQHYQWPLLFRTTSQQCYPALPMSTVIQDYQSAVLPSTTNEHCYSGLPISSVTQHYQWALLFRTTNQQCYPALPMLLPCHVLVLIATERLITSPDRCWSADMLMSADVGTELPTSPALVYNNADGKSCLPGIRVCHLNCKCQTPFFLSLNKNNNILVLHSPNQNKWQIKSKDGFDMIHIYIYVFSSY